MNHRIAIAWLLAMLVGACTTMQAARDPSAPRIDVIERNLAGHIAVLASDEYGGRRPGTEGEAKTLRYLAHEWQAAGLESGTNDPANPWFAPVELSLSTPSQSRVEFRRKGRVVTLPAGAVTVFSSGRRTLVEQAPLLFVGRHGADLENSELAGRVAVMLWDHADEREQMEVLIEHGAAAVLAVVPDEAALSELLARQRHGQYLLKGEGAGTAMYGYMSLDTARQLLGDAVVGRFVDAAEPKPEPVPLTATLEATSTLASVKTYNLIARLPGKQAGAGAVLLVAHWDHFGQCGEAGAVDTICNGAVDNASGLAVLIELAKHLAAGPRPERDVYFLATTGEEWGLLGARAFTQEPPIPLDTIVAAFNVDSIAVAPRGTPVVLIGHGLTGLDGDIAKVVAAQGRKLIDSPLADAYLRRQDGWALLQRDIPAVDVTSAFGDPVAFNRFERERYHKPGDEPDKVELGGAAEDLLLHLALVRHFANPRLWPGGMVPLAQPGTETAPAPPGG
ncbi:MAG: M28 family peptidase [Sphingomonadales bacterium]|nr:M28 family peptidase [Sphingomonadales bacterium]MBD3774517.1 M28 family peptidase [Paracoccaceae bacterium]